MNSPGSWGDPWINSNRSSLWNKVFFEGAPLLNGNKILTYIITESCQGPNSARRARTLPQTAYVMNTWRVTIVTVVTILTIVLVCVLVYLLQHNYQSRFAQLPGGSFFGSPGQSSLSIFLILSLSHRLTNPICLYFGLLQFLGNRWFVNMSTSV